MFDTLGTRNLEEYNEVAPLLGFIMEMASSACIWSCRGRVKTCIWLWIGNKNYTSIWTPRALEHRAYSPIGLIAPSTPCAYQEETIEWRMAVDSASVSPGHK